MILTQSEKSRVINNTLKVSNEILIENKMGYLIPMKNVVKQRFEPGCNTETNFCKNIISIYKSICRKVWDKKCLKDMSIDELMKISKDAKKCAKHRKEFQNKCCNGIDSGHIGAIEKMKRVHDLCENEIFERIGSN